MRRSVLLLTVLGFVSLLNAQHDALQHRHDHIQESYEEEVYHEVLSLIDEQFKEAKGTTWQDSLYQYAYEFGRSTWKISGPERAQEAVWSYYDRIRVFDRSAEHLVEVLGDASWILYEVGSIKECLTADSIAAEIANSDPNIPIAVKGKSLHFVGFDLHMLGEQKRALSYFEQAVAVYRTGDSTHYMNLAESLNGIGSCYWHLGDNAQAEKFYLASLQWLGDSEDLDIVNRKASAYGNLSLVSEDEGDLIKAKEYANMNLRIKDWVIANAEDPTIRDEAYFGRATTLANLAELYFSLGDYGRSKELLDRSTKDKQRVLEANDPKLLSNFERYADILFESGSIDSALAIQKNYVEALTAAFEETSKIRLRGEAKYARFLTVTGEHEKSIAMLDRCIDMQLGSQDGIADADIALYYVDRARAYISMDRLEDALSDLAQARAIRARIFGSQSVKVSEVDMLSVEVLMEKNPQDGRLRSSLDSVEHFMLNAGELMVSQGVSAADRLMPSFTLFSIQRERAIGEGDPIEQLGRIDKALDLLNTGQLALSDDESRLIRIGEHHELFALGKAIAWELYVQNPSVEWQERLLTYTEKSNSTLLRSRLNEFSGMSFSTIPDSIRKKESLLKAGMTLEGPDTEAVLALSELEQELEAFISMVEKKYPAYHHLKYGDQVATLRQIQNELIRDGQHVVLFSESVNGMLAMVISTDEVRISELSGSYNADNVHALNKAIEEQDLSTYLELAHELFLQLVEPWSDVVQTDELFIIPTGELHYLNFECLLKEPSTAENYHKSFLGLSNTISYLMSATTTLRFNDIKDRSESGILALAPGFSDELKKHYASLDEQGEPFFDISRYVRQPFTTASVKGMGERFDDISVLLGQDANESLFKEKAGKYGIIHLGTHAEMNNNSPLYSKFILGRSMDEDGYLHTYELYEMELNAQLAVLSACETGIGKRYSSEGLRSLAHGFAYAGCPSLVTSLWKVDEKSTTRILDLFYEQLESGSAKNVALRESKMRFIEESDPALRFPLYWAGMILVGDVGPVSIEPEAFPWAQMIGGSVVILLLLFWYKRSRSSTKKPLA